MESADECNTRLCEPGIRWAAKVAHSYICMCSRRQPPANASNRPAGTATDAPGALSCQTGFNSSVRSGSTALAAASISTGFATVAASASQ
jgi:hypothetical protein